MGNLLELIGDLQKDKRLYTYDEASTKQAVILPILNFLGWNTHKIDEVTPEYSLRGKKVDYCLRHKGTNKVFLEIKKVSEELEKHEEQLLMYCFEEGIKLAVLTNGINWWFYLPLQEGNWREKRKFYAIEIYVQSPEEIVDKFVSFLSKDKVISGEAFNNAERIFQNKQKQTKIREAIPRAWYTLLNESNEELIKLISETTEKISGYYPEIEEIERFLGNYLEKERIIPPPKKIMNNTQKKENTAYIRKGYTGQKIVSFKFENHNFLVKSWREFLLNICEIMLSKVGPIDFQKVLQLEGKKRPYFSKEPNALRTPEKIKNTDIYIETNLSANSIVQLSKIVISLFGYKDKDLIIVSE